MTTTILAHFDGHVIVPEEPLSLTPGEKVRVTIEREADADHSGTRPSLLGILEGKVWVSDDFDQPLKEFEEYH